MMAISPSLRRVATLSPATAIAGAAYTASAPRDSLPADAADFLGRIAGLGFDSVLAAAQQSSIPADRRDQPLRLERAALVSLCQDAGLSVLTDVVAPPATDDAMRSWIHSLVDAAQAGVSGVRCLHLGRQDSAGWKALLAMVHEQVPGFLVAAWTPGLPLQQAVALRDVGFDACFSSLAWWDQRAPWLVDEHERLRRFAPVIAPATTPRTSDDALDPRHLASKLALAQRIWTAAYLAQGLMIDAEQAVALQTELREANGWAGSIGARRGRPIQLSGPMSPATALFWHGGASSVLVLHHRPALWEEQLRMVQARLPDGFVVHRDALQHTDCLRKGGSESGPVSLLPVERVAPLRARNTRTNGDAAEPAAVMPEALAGPSAYQALKSAMSTDRIAIENVTPRIDGGRFAVKATLGRVVQVEADVFMDGHAPLQACLLWRSADETHWQHVAMVPGGNDRWQAEFAPRRLGRHYYTIQAWAHPEAPQHRSAQCAVFPLQVDRREAEFSSWYELFPRSMGEPGRHGTLKDVIPRLADIRAMGFDVLYFPPIHPIGHTNRKGRNNTLKAGPGDPGSPYAIGSEHGGHDAIHPELGTAEDFRELLVAARAHDLEIALDFAIQCSPDHPWLREHPEWFRWREDGTVQYAENPPKRYEDIVNPDFYSETASSNQRIALWRALRDVVLFWAGQGVRTFRVDNPHTKPLPFWEWMIAEVQKRYPDAIFLSEAFTRPKMMYRLAKLGFTQSYTYFTWRNEKAELTDYLTEISSKPQVDYFRPHFFVNTPDINPYFLQDSGRAGFLIRAALATTTSGLWGMYSGFELCESQPLPGKEEYLDSEKYELRARDWQQPGNIAAEITRLNAIRRANPALQTHRGIEFHAADDERVLFFSKATPEGDNIVLVAVSLDPHASITTVVHFPSWIWARASQQGLRLRSLWDDHDSYLTNAEVPLSLSPEQPFVLWSVWP